MKAGAGLLFLALLFSGFSGCKQDEKPPCQRLAEKEAECGFENGVSLGDCQKSIKSLQMRTALDCLKATDCQQFLSCRKKADELKGLKTGLENL